MKIRYCILVLLLAILACKQPEVNINEDASLPESFQFDKLDLRTIGSTINSKARTTSILYGNNNALNALINPEESIKGEKILVFITWEQQDDPRWFGAKIPSDFLMMEILKTNDDFSKKEKINYVLEKGKYFKTNIETDLENRIEYITQIQPAIMP